MGGSSLMDRLLTVATVIVALAAVAVATLRIHEHLYPRQVQDGRTTTIDDWEKYAEAGIVVGPPEAPVTIIEFSDFQCGFCASAAPYLRNLIERNAEKIRWVYRHFPGALHQAAFAAALATECAHQQGRFLEFHDLLFAQQDSLGEKSWGRFAAEAGVADTTALTKCMQSDWARQRVEADTLAGRELGGRGTPTFLVNDRMIHGYSGPGVMDSYVRSALEVAGFAREDLK